MSGIQNALWRHSIWKTMPSKFIDKQEQLPKLGFFRKKKKENKHPSHTHTARTSMPTPRPFRKQNSSSHKTSVCSGTDLWEPQDKAAWGRCALGERREEPSLHTPGKSPHRAPAPPAPLLLLKHARHTADSAPGLSLFLLECSSARSPLCPCSLLHEAHPNPNPNTAVRPSPTPPPLSILYLLTSL